MAEAVKRVCSRGTFGLCCILAEIALGSRSREIVAVDEALDALAQIDPRKAKVIELRFFGGLSVEETAEVLKISPKCHARLEDGQSLALN